MNVLQIPQDHALNSQRLIRIDDVLADYRLAILSRQISLIGRRDVLSGNAKFGIFGDGKELPQLAMARAFQKGDFRSGYYRDQTFMFAIGETTPQQFFAQLYANPDPEDEPNSAGRQMNAHFATKSLNSDGSWRDLTAQYNSSADISPTAGQMPRLVGLAYASRLYRELEELHHLSTFSKEGNEIAFGTIGNASCAEGPFWESVNAIGVLKSPAIISIWDDGYGISVPNEHQIVKQDLTALLSGFGREQDGDSGYHLYTVPGWDYPRLIETYAEAAAAARRDHIPAIVHVIEVTQPQGHSTSGSHERYKSTERLEWEVEYDGLARMREWILSQQIADEKTLDAIERDMKIEAEQARTAAWESFTAPLKQERAQLDELLATMQTAVSNPAPLEKLRVTLGRKRVPHRRDLMETAVSSLILTKDEVDSVRQPLINWRNTQLSVNNGRYGSHLYSQTPAITTEIKPIYSPDSLKLPGFKVLNSFFDQMLARDPRVIAFGEDVGALGGVNQTFAGMQVKYGALRVSDTGIREATIMGQAIGMALRGLRPIAEIQYLDYVLYGLQVMSDDLASTHWRTKGGQKAPVIVSTRGHRLEGIWHAGSPMAAILHLVNGMHVLVPRDMVRAAGFYNTLLQGDDPGLIVEVLNGYRLKERLPDNIADVTVPLGVPDILREGEDITLVTYGAGCQIGLMAAAKLEQVGIDVELIDVQSLLPFDINGRILQSLRKTGHILFMDEDVPGGTTAYMLQEVMEKQGGFWELDSEPRTLSAKPHRPSYGADGGYFSKPNVEDVFLTIYEMMHEVEPTAYPLFYK